MAFQVAKIPYLIHGEDQLEFNDYLPHKQVLRIRCGGLTFLAALIQSFSLNHSVEMRLLYMVFKLNFYLSFYLSIYLLGMRFEICNLCNLSIIMVSSLNYRIYVARGNAMGAHMMLQEVECQVYQESSGCRCYKSFVGGSKREGSPCWVVQMPEVWPSSKVLQLTIQDKLLQVTLAFTGEDLTFLKFRSKRTFDMMEEIVRAWDLKSGFPLCSFSFVHLDNHIGEKD